MKKGRWQASGNAGCVYGECAAAGFRSKLHWKWLLPKSENRRPRSDPLRRRDSAARRSPKSEVRTDMCCQTVAGFRISSFGFLSAFGFRPSDFCGAVAWLWTLSHHENLWLPQDHDQISTDFLAVGGVVIFHRIIVIGQHKAVSGIGFQNARAGVLHFPAAGFMHF
jgi:hypothetical protein